MVVVLVVLLDVVKLSRAVQLVYPDEVNAEIPANLYVKGQIKIRVF